MSLRLAFSLAICLALSASVLAQQGARVTVEQCGTLPRLQLKMQRNPELRKKFEQQKAAFTQAIGEAPTSAGSGLRTENTQAAVYIPVIFHVVLPNPNVVTDAMIQAQLDTLNHDYAGANGDSVRIPAYFKPLFGKSIIQFCRAQRTPDDDISNGIDRVSTGVSSFTFDDKVKHEASGGVNAWNSDKYLNVWITQLSGGLLGYATFPNDGIPEEQGVVIDWRTLPGGSMTGFNRGRTLTHETGHYFNLFHIWGDDNGSCSGSDGVADTPNQADATSGCFSGVRTDACTTGGNGIMYQNYMDYSSDVCLVMFTTQQVARMESALNTFRSSLLSSNGCQLPVLKNFDVQLRTIDQPAQRICASSFVPYITLRNRGSQTITSLQIKVQVDNGTATTINWTGQIPSTGSVTISLGTVNTTTGAHTLTITALNPNGVADEDPTNNSLSLSYQYLAPVTAVTEGFEGAGFPPAGWDVVNPDGDLTWQRVNGVGRGSNASVMINNFDYDQVGQRDDLRMPPVGIASTVDSAFLSFDVAAAVYTAPNTPGNVWDTLQILVSTDCGATYTSLYKKWGGSLITRLGATTTPFVPVADEWRRDSINLANYIGNPNLLIAFRNSTGFENNIWLDNINLRTVSVNPNLKKEGLLVTPNPTNSAIAVQFYPQPTNLKAIQVYNYLGQKLEERLIGNNAASNYYSFSLGRYAAGTYIVRIVFADRVITKRILKL